MSLLTGTILLQSSAPQGSEPSPDWALTLLGLLFSSMLCMLAAIVWLAAWGLSKASGGTRRKPRRGRGGGMWVAVPHDDLWMHFPDPEDAREGRRPRAPGGARPRPGPSRADLWDEP